MTADDKAAFRLENDATAGKTASRICKDWTPKSNRDLAWCKDYMVLVPGSVDFDKAALTRWRETYFASWCPGYARSPDKKPDLAWCLGYLPLTPGSATFAGGEKLDKWLFDRKRYQYVCYNLPKGAEMSEPCSGYVSRGGLHSWREG
ncbi:hypothetical protein [Mesorhizobium sp. A623]